MKMFLFAFGALFPLVLVVFAHSVASNFYSDVYIQWGGDGRGKIYNDGHDLQLSMDYTSGSSFHSYSTFLFGRFDVQMKLIRGNSAGTVTSIYVSSDGPRRDEVDMEFLGNLEGQPYTLSTNIFTGGRGSREQQFRLSWFDPTADFHNYSILWTSLHVILYIDGIPIRCYMRSNDTSLPYLDKQPMSVRGSVWNGEDWATDGGRIKIDWTQAPFLAYYQNLRMQACAASKSGGFSCGPDAGSWMNLQLDAEDLKKMQHVRTNYMMFNYCTDPKNRFNSTVLRDCSRELF